MPAEQASQLLDHIVHQRVRELIDFCCLLDFEQELCHALADCGLTRDIVPRTSAEMIARALARIGEEHLQMVIRIDAEVEAAQRSKSSAPD